jgi:hypothetical protein
MPGYKQNSTATVRDEARERAQMASAINEIKLAENTKSLFKAARAGDLEEIKALLHKISFFYGRNLPRDAINDKNPMHYAAIYKHAEVFMYFQNKFPEISKCKYSKGRVPINYASPEMLDRIRSINYGSLPGEEIPINYASPEMLDKIRSINYGRLPCEEIPITYASLEMLAGEEIPGPKNSITSWLDTIKPPPSQDYIDLLDKPQKFTTLVTKRRASPPKQGSRTGSEL